MTLNCKRFCDKRDGIHCLSSRDFSAKRGGREGAFIFSHDDPHFTVVLDLHHDFELATSGISLMTILNTQHGEPVKVQE